jgi:phosphoadenosine phosphosulfate reductase
MPDTHRYTVAGVDELNGALADSGPVDVLKWGLDTFGDRIALCSAFGPEGMVLLHMLSQIDRRARIFTLDTGRLPNETYQLMQECEKRYGFRIDVYTPDPHDVREIIKAHGINLFYETVELRELCCEVRKVRPLWRALKGLAAWITGLRRIETVTRKAVQKVEIDTIHDDILKLNPLFDWSEQQVWDYIIANHLPYNVLHDRGYRSIGCAPCTRATNPGEDIRAGRWWWEAGDNKECGIHISAGGAARVNGSKGAF